MLKIVNFYTYCFFLVEWTINNLSIKMRVPATTLRRRIGFWQNQVCCFLFM